MKPLPARIFHQWSRQTFCSLASLGSLRSHKVLVTLVQAHGVYFCTVIQAAVLRRIPQQS